MDGEDEDGREGQPQQQQQQQHLAVEHVARWRTGTRRRRADN